MTDYTKLSTPPTAVADFCLIPIGTPSASVSNEVASVQRLMKASGLTYSMHSAGTTVEGSWDQVMRIIGQAHTLVHQNGVVRIQSDIRVGTRTDKKQHFSEKVAKVESILAADGGTGTSGAAGKAGGAGATAAVAPAKTVPEILDAEGNSGKGDTVSLPRQGGESKEPHKGTWASMFKK